MVSRIEVNDAAHVATIDIEGVIGVPEQIQFESPEKKVATYDGFTAALAKVKELKAVEVVVNIRSAGGDVHDALLIYDALTSLDAVITTRCYGYVASAATIIAQAASVGRREISSNSLYLIHCSESAAEGNARSLEATKELLDKTDTRIASIYALRSGRQVEDYVALMNENGGKGRWIEACEAVEAGLVDVVIPPPVRNEVCAADNEIDQMCRLFGLNPPDRIAEDDSEADKKGLIALRTLWNAFVKLFRPDNDSPDNRDVNAVENALDADSDAPASDARECVADPKAQITGVADRLPTDKKVVELQHRDLQSEAFATMTKPVEDPSVEDYELTPNQTAYEQDALNLKRRA